jgi:hypothetical protein
MNYGKMMMYNQFFLLVEGGEKVDPPSNPGLWGDVERLVELGLVIENGIKTIASPFSATAVMHFFNLTENGQLFFNDCPHHTSSKVN